MAKDNSKISKQIINFIINRDNFPNLSEEQIEVLKEGLPAELNNITSGSLIQNSRIKGSDDKVYKINYNESSKWVSFTGSQRKLSKVMTDMGMPVNEDDSSEENLFRIIKEKGVNNYVGQMLEYMNVDDVWVLINKEISDIKNISIEDLQFDFEKLTTDILTDQNKRTWFIKWEGQDLFQIQSSTIGRPSSPIFRINKDLITKFIETVKQSTETWGISVEVALCELNSIVIPPEYKGRYDPKLVSEAKGMISGYFKNGNKLPAMTECLATKLNGKKKSPTDFMAGEFKVSVKTNYNGNTKVCPPDIGQPGIKEGIGHYNKMMGSTFTEATLPLGNFLEFKKEFQNNISEIMSEQVRMLFSEDFILYLRKMKSGSMEIRFINTQIKEYKFDKSEFTFSRSPEEWNESVSIRYTGISVAEMQMHSGRSPFKFRLNLPNLMEIIKNEQGN